jgi:hypothetical protein
MSKLLLIVMISIMISMGVSLADPWESYQGAAYSRSDVIIGPGNNFTASSDGIASFPNGLTVPSGKNISGELKLADNSLASGVNGLKIGADKFSMSVLTGGAAGNHTLTGINLGDEIIGIVYFAGGASLTSVADLTSEFAVLDANVIENAGHTATTDGFLVVNWIDRT